MYLIPQRVICVYFFPLWVVPCLFHLIYMPVEWSAVTFERKLFQPFCLWFWEIFLSMRLRTTNAFIDTSWQSVVLQAKTTQTPPALCPSQDPQQPFYSPWKPRAGSAAINSSKCGIVSTWKVFLKQRKYQLKKTEDKVTHNPFILVNYMVKVSQT